MVAPAPRLGDTTDAGEKSGAYPIFARFAHRAVMAFVMITERSAFDTPFQRSSPSATASGFFLRGAFTGAIVADEEKMRKRKFPLTRYVRSYRVGT